MVIEVGRLWRCLVFLEVTNISSVLMSLSFTMFAVAHALTSQFKSQFHNSIATQTVRMCEVVRHGFHFNNHQFVHE